MNISKLSSQQLWIASAVVPFVFTLFFSTVLFLGEVFHIEVGSVLDLPVVAHLLPAFLLPGALFMSPFGLLFTFLFPSSDAGLSLIFIFSPWVSFLLYTCMIRLIIDFSLKFLYEKR